MRSGIHLLTREMAIKMIKKLAVLVLILGIAFTLTACDSADDGSGSGELALSIADKPVNNVDQVLVTIEEVQVNKDTDDEEGWKTINDFDDLGGEREFDLMTLRFDEELLGQETLDAGFYNQIRLIVAADEDNSDPTTAGKSKVVYKDGTEDNLFIPSGAQTGLKINHNFEINEDSITKLLLDVDVSEIMHQAGNSGKIILRPTAIEIVDQIISGNILGRVVDTAGEYSFENDVVVEVYNNDDTIADTEPVKSTVAAAEAVNDQPIGSFLIRGLEEGTYKLYAYTADDEGVALEDALTGTVADIEVSEGQRTELENNIVLE